MMVDTLIELRKDFDRTLLKKAEFETMMAEKEFDIRIVKEYREWLSLSANIAERICLLESKEKIFGYDQKRVSNAKKALAGNWSKGKKTAKTKGFRDKERGAKS
jgi:hypothetical protein